MFSHRGKGSNYDFEFKKIDKVSLGREYQLSLRLQYLQQKLKELNAMGVD